jgi:ankyrin repeat protein
MLTKHFNKLVYLIVFIGISSANAGSYDDFFIAIRNDNVGTVKDLLQRGFDPNTRDAKGNSGLTIAMREQSLKAARALLAVPAVEVDTVNQAGESALMLAALKGDLVGMGLLLDRGAHVNRSGWSALHYAATGPEAQAVRLLLDRGAEVNATSPNGSTPLMMAAQYGTEASVKLLLDRGADVKLRNQRELTAVDFARLSGREPLTRMLGKLLP